MGRDSCIFPAALWGNKNPWQFWSQKSVPFLCPALCPRAAFYSKDHRSARKHAHYYGRDRIATLFPDAQARTMHEWAGPRGNAVYYGRDPAKTLIRLWTGPHFTLFSMDGSAPKHSLLWAGPRRALITMGGPAPGHSLLWDGPAPGPHRALITMGGPAPGHSLLWAGPQRARIPMGGPATPFGPYKVISKRC